MIGILTSSVNPDKPDDPIHVGFFRVVAVVQHVQSLDDGIIKRGCRNFRE